MQILQVIDYLATMGLHFALLIQKSWSLHVATVKYPVKILKKSIVHFRIMYWSLLFLLYGLSTIWIIDVVIIDVVTAFLHGKLDQQIFMECPPGLKRDPDDIVELLKTSVCYPCHLPSLNRCIHSFGSHL